MLTNGDINQICATFERKTLFVRMEHFWDLLFNLMTPGTSTLHVAFYIVVQYNTFGECSNAMENSVS
jgi:hypothetical protein